MNRRTNRKITQCMLLGLFRQCIMIILIVTEVANVDLPRFKCPETSQWKFRAASECNDTDKYICLFDENGQKDEEFCGSWPDFENPGYKQILLGGTTREPCSDNRFQPFTFWTNGSSKCIYKKTNCNQEGQVIHNSGSLKTNRICRCDYTNNYDFVLKPRNGCFCVPSEEDCSCYVKTCPTGHRLTRDYECLKESKLKFNCPEIYKDSTDEQVGTTTIITLDENETSADSLKWAAVIVTFVCITAVCVIIFVYRMSENRNNFGVSSTTRQMHDKICLHSIPGKPTELTRINGYNANEIPYDVLGLQKKEILKWRKNHEYFVETAGSKNVLKKVKSNGYVILSGPPGCGKSAIAYNTAFMLEKNEEFNILPVSSPEEIRRYLQPETKQVFVIDDPVGKYTVDDSCIQRWKNEETLINQTFTDRSNTKLILTCRSYIYESGFSRKLNFSPGHCDLLSYDFKLTFPERERINHKYNIPHLNEDTLMMYDFFPLLCAVYSKQEDKTMFFRNPYKVLTGEMKNMKEKSDIAFLAIALLIVQDNNIEKKILSLENHTTKEVLNDLCNECGFKYFPSTVVLQEALNYLIGTYVKETDNVFSCIHDTLFQNISFIVGSSIIYCLLTYGSCKFLANRMQLASIQQEHANLVIIVNPEQEKLFFNRLLSDIKKGYHNDVLTGIQMKYSRFRSKLLTFLEHSTAEDLRYDENSSTPLHVVSEHGYDDLVFKLFQLRKDQINHQDNNKRTPLFLACLNGHDKVIQTLLTLDNSSLHVANNEDLSPLDAAAINDHCSTVKLLLHNDANVKRKDSNMKRTALQRACDNGSYNAVTSLLTTNADVKHKDAYGLEAIHIACSKGHLEIVELLLNHDKSMIKECDAHGRTPLLTACESNQQNIVCMLLENKANVNQTDGKQSSPLYKACQLGHEKIVGLLLDNSAKVNKKSYYGYSPLHAASIKDRLKCVEILLDKNAEVDLATEQGWTAFFFSCSKGHLEICKLLHLSAASVNVCDKSATTPLHVACRENHERIVRFLIEHDANVNAVNRRKESPLYTACLKESFVIVQLLLDHSADVNICEEKGNSPLHVACFKGSKTIVQLLLDHKADIHKRNKAGKTSFDLVQGTNDIIVDVFNCYKET